jgi:L-aspartate oxidase
VTAPLLDTRRYLTNFDSSRSANLFTDVLVVGTGVAGARAALAAIRHGSVTLITKAAFGDSSTSWAQGGIAGAVGPADSPDKHFEDTVRVGCGLNRPEAVRLLVTEGPGLIRELLEWGFEADRENGSIALGREGGHSLNRVVHSMGDRTGGALVATLEQKVRTTAGLRVFENCFLVDLLTIDERCLGAVTYHPMYGHQLIWAKQTVLAVGGCGQVWRETTNPAVATGDGLAAAFRAGVRLLDVELMQFHPTTLYVAGAGRALISEAVRGEGAYLVDREGRRFMLDQHRDAELAPRDVVSLAIHRYLEQYRANCVYLDVRHIPLFAGRFPRIAQLCRDFEIDVTRDLIPVRPSAHYMIGGVDVALDGSSSLEGLLACGEASCTGVHGANRLASNSLLEGLVFGRIAGETAGRRAARMEQPAPVRRIVSDVPPSPRTALDLPDIRNSLRSLMWRNVGIERADARLKDTCDVIWFWTHYTLDKTFDEPGGWELQNMLTTGAAIAAAARERTESIGVHYRGDAPAPPPGAGHLPAAESYHVAIQRRPDGTEPRRVPTTVTPPMKPR